MSNKKPPWTRKVKSFKSSWLDQSIEGTKAALWLKPDPSNPARAICKICPLPNSFSINEGWKAITQHFGTTKHQQKLEACQSDPNFKQVNNNNTSSIEDGLTRMKENEQQKLKAAEKALRSQAKYVCSSMYHQVSGRAMDCQAELFPQLFGCQTSKLWDCRRTKATYLATHGLHPFFRGKIVKAMQERHYSINFDESTVNGVTQLDLNSSYIDDDLLVTRRMLSSIIVDEGTSSEEITEKVLGQLDSDRIDPQMMINCKTDGCHVMLGAVSGVQERLREVVPTLPKWGGCTGHDCSNVLKSATKALNPELVKIYPALFGCLSKHSMHKKRDFERIEEFVGLDIRKVPKFLDVRFRVIARCAEYMELQDRALYEYFSNMKAEIKKGKYEASETEMTVLEKYIDCYLEIRLCNSFIIEVSKPVIEVIDFFESNEVRVQYQYDKMVMLLYDYLSKFVKNAGIGDEDAVTGKSLLKVSFDKVSDQLSNKEIWLGKKAEALLQELGLNRESEEIGGFLENVRDFYVEAVNKMIKYFAIGIKSQSLRALSVLNPDVWKTKGLDHLKKQWRILGEKFTNVIETADLPEMMSEVANLKRIDGMEEEDDDEEKEPDKFFAKLAGKKDVNGVKEFPLVSKLGSSLCTSYNSSSPAERDFSFMNTIADSTKNRTSQLLLETKMSIKAEINRLQRACKKCKVLKKEGKKADHCHCSQWSPPEDLMKMLRDGGPYRRYKKDLEEKAQEERDKQVLKDLMLEEDRSKKISDMKKELENLKRRIRREKKEKAADAEKKKTAKKKKKSLFEESVAPKRKVSGGPSKAEQRREAQRKRLDL